MSKKGFWEGSRLSRRSERPLQSTAEDADNAFPEKQDADDEDRSLDDCDPRSEIIERVLDRHDDGGAGDRPENRSHSPDERHENDFAGHAPMHIGERCELRYDGLGSSGHSGERGGQNKDGELVAGGPVAERDRARLVIADGL